MNETLTEKRYGITKSIKGIMTFGLIFFSLGLVVSIILCFVEPILISAMWWIWVPVIFAYIIFVKLFYSAWRERNNYIAFDETAIYVRSGEKTLEALNWKDIIEIKESTISKRITLHGNFNKHVKLEYQLGNLCDLLLHIVQKVTHLDMLSSKHKKFHKSSHFKIFFGVAFLLFAILGVVSFSSGAHMVSFGLMAVSCLPLYILSKEIWSIQIGNEYITLQYPLKRKRILHTEIEDIVLEDVEDNNGDSFPAVKIRLNGINDIKLSGVKEGTIPLYYSLRTAFENNS